MRNLWLLLQRNAFLLTFLLLLGVSFGVLVRHDGSARSSWFRTTGGLAAGVEGQQQQWRDYLELAEKNAALAQENAQLRSQLLSMERDGQWHRDDGSGWSVTTGMLIKGPDGLARSMALGTPGTDGGLSIGMGVLSNGIAIGTVVDVGERYSRILPMLNTAGTWSCRVGRTGPVVPLQWEGRDAERYTLSDVPRYTRAEVGDTVFTSGFDLPVPDGIPVGTVHSSRQSGGSDGPTVSVVPLGDITSVRHLEYIRNRSDSERTVLAQPLPQP